MAYSFYTANNKVYINYLVNYSLKDTRTSSTVK